MKVLQNANNASKTHQNPFTAGATQNAPPLDRLANRAPNPAEGAIGAPPGPLAGFPPHTSFSPYNVRGVE